MKLIIAGFAFLFIEIFTVDCGIAQTQSATFSGRVNRVWDDGFELISGRRSIIVDSYDLCGDKAFRSIAVGNKVTVTGEFEGGEFDAFSIIKANGKRVCS